jgi:hypothetical protein
MHANNPFAPQSRGMMCPMIADSTTATIEGIWFGHPVSATFTKGGCGQLRWARIDQIFN